MISTLEAKKPVITVYPRDIAFFEANYPIHHAILLQLIERGEARVETRRSA